MPSPPIGASRRPSSRAPRRSGRPAHRRLRLPLARPTAPARALGTAAMSLPVRRDGAALVRRVRAARGRRRRARRRLPRGRLRVPHRRRLAAERLAPPASPPCARACRASACARARRAHGPRALRELEDFRAALPRAARPRAAAARGCIAQAPGETPWLASLCDTSPTAGTPASPPAAAPTSGCRRPRRFRAPRHGLARAGRGRARGLGALLAAARARAHARAQGPLPGRQLLPGGARRARRPLGARLVPRLRGRAVEPRGDARAIALGWAALALARGGHRRAVRGAARRRGRAGARQLHSGDRQRRVPRRPRGDRRGRDAGVTRTLSSRARRVGARSTARRRCASASSRSAVATAVALVAFGWSWMEVSPHLERKAYYELLFWGGGHVLQFTWTLLMLVALAVARLPRAACACRSRRAWRCSSSRSRSPRSSSTPVIYLAYPVASVEHHKLQTWLMRFGGGLAILPIGLALLWARAPAARATRGRAPDLRRAGRLDRRSSRPAGSSASRSAAPT